MPEQQASSIYERVRTNRCEDFAGSYEGNLNAVFCTVSDGSASEEARAAIQATATRGGFMEADLIWVDSSTLEPADLFTLVETVDPLCVVILDQRAGEALSRAYNQPIKLEHIDSLLARPTVCFVDFTRTLQSDERKLQAWALLKELLLRAKIQ